MNECGYKENFTTQIVAAELTQKNQNKDIFIFEFSN